MLSTLSGQEQRAVMHFDERVRQGNFDEYPLYLDWHIDSAFRGVPRTGEIVDVGCGFGRAVPMLWEAGFTRYFGIDPSRESVRYCRSLFPGNRFEVDEIKTLGDHHPRRFDAFFLICVLMFIPRKDMGRAINSLRRSLRTGAAGFFALPYGTPDSLEVVSAGGLPVTFLTIDEAVDAFVNNGFVLSKLDLDDPMFLGRATAV